MDEPDADEGIDRLYAVAPERFTQERDALARALRERDREAAARVKALRRPPVTAWALNQVARSSPEQLAALFDADTALARSQREGAGREALAAAAGARREIIRRLVSEAASVLAGAGHPDSPANRDRMAQTLTAVAVDEEGRAALAGGRLTGDLTPGSIWESAAPTGFEVEEAGEGRESGQRAERGRELRERAAEVAAEARRLDEEAARLEWEADRAEVTARTARGAAITARRQADESAGRARAAGRAAAESAGGSSDPG